MTIRGKIDSKSFVIARTKTLSKGSLTFILDEVDLTRQSVKETQLIIDETLGAGSQILSRTIFHGQHSINGLLEATDAKLKEELSLIVPLKLWQDAANHARKKGRELSKSVSELSGMIGIREQDVVNLERKYKATIEAIVTKENELNMKKEKLSQLSPVKSTENETVDMESRRIALHDAEVEVQIFDKQLELSKLLCQEEARPIQKSINEISARIDESKESLSQEQRESGRREASFESALEAKSEMEKKWGLFNSEDLDSFVPPIICPTCNQPTNDEASHEHLKNDLVNSFTASNEKIEVLSKLIAVDKEKIASIQNILDSLEIERKTLIADLELKERNWKANSLNLQNKLQSARERYAEISTSLSNDLEKMAHQNNLKQLESDAKAELKLCENNLQMVRQLSETTKNELELMMKNVETLKAEQDTKRGHATTSSKVAEYFGARGIQTFVLQNTVLALQLVTQSYLDELSDGALRLKLSLDDGDRISRTVSVLGPDGSWVDRPLSSLSG